MWLLLFLAAIDRQHGVVIRSVYLAQNNDVTIMW
jgi:hypothetical protein